MLWETALDGVNFKYKVYVGIGPTKKLAAMKIISENNWRAISTYRRPPYLNTNAKLTRGEERKINNLM